MDNKRILETSSNVQLASQHICALRKEWWATENVYLASFALLCLLRLRISSSCLCRAKTWRHLSAGAIGSVKSCAKYSQSRSKKMFILTTKYVSSLTLQTCRVQGNSHEHARKRHTHNYIGWWTTWDIYYCACKWRSWLLCVVDRQEDFATERHKELHLSELWIRPAPSFRIRAPWTRLVPACIPRQVTLNNNLPLPGKLVHTKWTFLLTDTGAGSFTLFTWASDSLLATRFRCVIRCS